MFKLFSQKDIIYTQIFLFHYFYIQILRFTIQNKTWNRNGNQFTINVHQLIKEC